MKRSGDFVLDRWDCPDGSRDYYTANKISTRNCVMKRYGMHVLQNAYGYDSLSKVVALEFFLFRTKEFREGSEIPL